MILIDYNQQLVSCCHYLQKNNIDVNLDTLQHTFFTYINDRIHSINNSTIARKYGKFSMKADDIVICCDGKNYWRRDIFPYYKVKRKSAREKSTLDWQAIFKYSDDIKSTIKNHTRMKLIHIDKVEADDVISTLVANHHHKERICIISTDKDFVQLQEYPNVWQFSTMSNTFIKPETSGLDALITKLISGDSGDGVPNVLSDDDIFTQKGKRQTPIRKDKFDLLFRTIKRKITKKASYDDLLFLEQYSTNLNRNNQLMNLLTQIPSHIKDEIIQELEFITEHNNSLNNFDCYQFADVHGYVNQVDKGLLYA